MFPTEYVIPQQFKGWPVGRLQSVLLNNGVQNPICGKSASAELVKVISRSSSGNQIIPIGSMYRLFYLHEVKNGLFQGQMEVNIPYMDPFGILTIVETKFPDALHMKGCKMATYSQGKWLGTV